jgi:epsilon-lactone hydrolase
MAQKEIEAIRELLVSKPRPVGWIERRQRLNEVGSVWRVADDVKLIPVDAGGVAGEWSSVPGSDLSRVLLFFHGGGYCSGSIRSHRRMVSEAGRAAKARTLAIAYRLAPEHPYPAALPIRHGGFCGERELPRPTLPSAVIVLAPASRPH